MGKRKGPADKPVNKSGKTQNVLCTQCSLDCAGDSIYCSSCRQWTHIACVRNLNDNLLQRLRNKYVLFLCPTCANVSGIFDCANSLRR